MALTRAVTLALATLFLQQQTAHAAAWSYCVAPADAQNKLYVSAPFPIGTADAAETGFETTLTEHHLAHDAVQCTHAGTEAVAIVMRQHAIDVNRDLRRQVIDVPWRPER